MADFLGKVVLVTGAGSGIGRAIAVALGAEGAVVYCCDVGRMDEAAAAVDAQGGRGVAVKLDVADRAGVKALFAEVMGEHGRLDGLVTSAGVMSDIRLDDLDEAALDRVLAINLKGTLWCCQAAAAIMVAQGSGSIVTLSSAVADRAAPATGAYAMSKGAVVQLTRVLALEVASSGVRVNAIAPGVIVTRITERHFTRPDGTVDEARRAQALARLAETSPMLRVGAAEEIAPTALYLLSDASLFVTGQVLRVNGGGVMG